MAAALSEPRDAIEEIIEPFLIQRGLLQRTPRGRLITDHAFKHLGLAAPARTATTPPGAPHPKSRSILAERLASLMLGLITVGAWAALTPSA
jgi:hypothetical protein